MTKHQKTSSTGRIKFDKIRDLHDAEPLLLKYGKRAEKAWAEYKQADEENERAEQRLKAAVPALHRARGDAFYVIIKLYRRLLQSRRHKGRGADKALMARLVRRACPSFGFGAEDFHLGLLLAVHRYYKRSRELRRVLPNIYKMED